MTLLLWAILPGPEHRPCNIMELMNRSLHQALTTYPYCRSSIGMAGVRISQLRFALSCLLAALGGRPHVPGSFKVFASQLIAVSVHYSLGVVGSSTLSLAFTDTVNKISFVLCFFFSAKVYNPAHQFHHKVNNVYKTKFLNK